MDLGEILYGNDNFEDDLNSLLFNLVASTISKWWKFKLLRWAQLLNRLVIWMKFYMGMMALDITSTTARR
jgi:hypothetical protein